MKTETVKVHAMDTTTNEWVWWLIDEDMADEFADSLLDCGFIFDRVDHTPEWLAENEQLRVRPFPYTDNIGRTEQWKLF